MNSNDFYQLYLQCNKVTIDSRKIEKNDIFFAFSGENFNAATLAKDAIKAGALAVIVEDKEYEDPHNNIYGVPSTLQFLQELSLLHRSKLNIPIIGLTGSNGKTTTKELIHAVLSQKYTVQYTFGNLNNHIGVPLTILSIKDHHQMAVIEMGANHQKEIAFLSSLAQPTIGYITNFGKAHLEGFGGVEGVIKGKSELYDFLIENNKNILVNNNDPIQFDKTKYYPNIITFGTPESDYFFEHFIENNVVGLAFSDHKIKSQLTGLYNFTNLCAAVSLGLHYNIEVDKIKNAIESYTPTNMRSQILSKNGKTLVLDTYNANPSSMAESLKNFKNFEGDKTIIIGDMLELGAESDAEHQQILRMALELNFDKIITVGQNFKKNNAAEFGAFDSTLELIEYLKSNPLDSKNILIKGSRGIALEKIIDYL